MLISRFKKSIGLVRADHYSPVRPALGSYNFALFLLSLSSSSFSFASSSPYPLFSPSFSLVCVDHFAGILCVTYWHILDPYCSSLGLYVLTSIHLSDQTWIVQFRPVPPPPPVIILLVLLLLCLLSSLSSFLSLFPFGLC